MSRVPTATTEVTVLPATLAELSIEQLIRKRVSLMLARLGDATVADLYELVMREVERGLLGLMLDRCDGNRGQAAAQLGLHRNTFRQKLERVGLGQDRDSDAQPRVERTGSRRPGR